MSSSSSNPIDSPFKIHPESNYFSSPPVLRSWSKPPSPVIWVTAVTSWVLSLFLLLSPVAYSPHRSQSHPAKPKWDHVSSPHKTLQWLPISFRVKPKSLQQPTGPTQSGPLWNLWSHLLILSPSLTLFQPLGPPCSSLNKPSTPLTQDLCTGCSLAGCTLLHGSLPHLPEVFVQMSLQWGLPW